MQNHNHTLFDLLLQKVGKKLQETHPEVTLPISEWKGENIELLREELLQKTNGTISEKWFYTHVKNKQDRLPRVDTLNILCQYIDEKSWNSFVHKNTIDYADKKEITTLNTTSSFVWKKIVIIGIVILPLLYFIFRKEKTTYTFCFVDKHTHLPVIDSFLEIKLIKANETPIFIPLKNNCFTGKGNTVEFVVKGRFYKPLHITRSISNTPNYTETIFVAPDDYTMMLHLFANSKVKDWKKRRKNLSEIMHNDLKVYEVNEDGYTMDVFNKKEFINKLTLPTRGLKKISIGNTQYKDGKIAFIKFIQL